MGRDFESGIFLKANSSVKVNYVKKKKLLTSVWTKSQMPFYSGLSYKAVSKGARNSSLKIGKIK